MFSEPFVAFGIGMWMVLALARSQEPPDDRRSRRSSSLASVTA